MSQPKFLLINYTKTLGKYKRVVYPRQIEREIRGNVLTAVPEDYISEFNIPYSFPYSYQTSTHKSHTRKYVQFDGTTKITNVRQFQGRKNITKKGILAILKKLKSSSGYLNPQFQIKTYKFRFPHYFNRSMIDQALFSILQNYSQRDKMFLKLGNKTTLLLGEATGWGTAKLSNTFISSNDHPSKLWGDVSICHQ